MTGSNFAIPLVVQPPAFAGTGKIGIGTGFLVADEDRLFLVTAAHVPVCVLRPPLDWSLWPAELLIMDPSVAPGGQFVTTSTIPLFNEQGGHRTPRFNFQRDPVDPVMEDLLVIPLTGEEQIAKEYSAFTLPAQASDRAVDEIVTLHGRWSNQTPELSMVLMRTVDQQGPLQLGVGVVPGPVGVEGNSGGPVVDVEGRLVGMICGTSGNIIVGHKTLDGQTWQSIEDFTILMNPAAILAVARSKGGFSEDFPARPVQ